MKQISSLEKKLQGVGGGESGGLRELDRMYQVMAEGGRKRSSNSRRMGGEVWVAKEDPLEVRANEENREAGGFEGVEAGVGERAGVIQDGKWKSKAP